MATIAGIIAEFNPFHNGHKALFEFARQSGAKCIITVMSGNYVQRGTAAIAEKHVRTQAALLNGADIVIELSLPHATAAAQKFAYSAAALLQATGVVDSLFFASESGQIAPLKQAAAAVQSSALSDALPAFLSQGHSFATARTLALEKIAGKELAALITEPNNILGVEYLQAAARLGWQMTPYTMPRQGVGHHSQNPKQQYASASFLRQLDSFSALRKYVPSTAYAVYRKAASEGLYGYDYGGQALPMLAQLRRLSLTELRQLPDISEGLEHRLHHAIGQSTSLSQVLATAKTKRYSLARLRRLVLAAYLGITAQDTAAPPPYLRLLGFSPAGRKLLTSLTKEATLPVSHSLLELQTHSKTAHRFAQLEVLSTDLYTLGLPQVQACGYELTKSGIFLP